MQFFRKQLLYPLSEAGVPRCHFSEERSPLLLPVGSLIYLLFCTSKWGWGFKNYQAEANKGEGLKVPDWVRVYLSYILPLLLLVLIVQGLIG